MKPPRNIQHGQRRALPTRILIRLAGLAGLCAVVVAAVVIIAAKIH